MSDVTDDGVIFHVLKVAAGKTRDLSCLIILIKQNKHTKFLLFKRSIPAEDDVLTASGGDKDVSLFTGLVHGGDLITYTATGHKDTFSSITGKHIMILKY